MSYEDGGMPAGGNSRFRGYPARMSERQQLALILQMTSQEMTSGPSNRSENSIPVNNSRSSPLQHQKSSKSRWSNKNADLLDGNTSFNRQDDRYRLANGCESKDRSEFVGSNSPDDVRTATGAESPVAAGSPAESAATVIPASSKPTAPTATSEEVVDKGPSIGASSSSSATSQQHQHQEDAAGISCEMRRTPPQNKVDRQTSASSGSGNSNVSTGGCGSTASATSQQQQQQQQQSGSAGSRVTLRLNQVRSARDEKKVTASGAAAAPGTTSGGSVATTTASTTTRQTGAGASTGSSSAAASALNSSQMEPSKPSGSGGSSSTIANASSSSVVLGGGGSGISNSNNGSSSSSADGGDVYEFKSSKEATPVRGSSTSPNPNPDKDGKDPSSSVLSSPTGSGQGQGNSSSGTGNAGVAGSSCGVSSNLSSITQSSANSGIGSSTVSSANISTSAEALSSSISTSMTDEPMMASSSPQSSSPSNKRSYENDNAQEDQDEEGRKRKKKESELNKEVGGPKGAISGRQTAARSNPSSADKQCVKSGKQPSPSSSFNANSPKPSSGNNPKGGTPSTESDGEDDRSKSSDCNLAPKVPPLKLVVQNSNSEPEPGNRNGKNTSNRSHQIHYVVASSNSNDSMDKDQMMSGATSGTTSPLDGSGSAPKSEDKKDFSGALDGESRSTHHQRVLRSSHRSGNGGNGNSSGREATGNIPGNGNYSNSSPLSVNPADRSNNSSPQRYNSPTPETGRPSETGKSISTDSSNQNSPAVKSSNTTDKCEKSVEIQKEPLEPSEMNIKKENTGDIQSTSSQAPVEFHPRKRKIKTNKESQQAAAAATAAVNETIETANTGPEIHPHDQPITNCIQLFLNIRKQIQQRRKGLFPVKPKPPQGFKNYLLNRCTYMLAGNANDEPNVNPPGNLSGPIKDLYISQEKERYHLRMQHVVEKEKLVLAKEQEIIRVHGRAARALANQEQPFSVCTFLKDEEVYNLITPEQEEKDRNARSRYTGRMFISWLQDVDDKWEKIKEGMILRHHNEAESLHAVQRMDWEWKLKEVGLCEFKVTPKIDKLHVPIVHVSDDFDLLPA